MAEPMGMSLTPGLRPHTVPMMDIRNQLLNTVGRRYECGLDEQVQVCPGLTWNQVFLEGDHLSRTDELRLLLKKSGVYRVRLP